MSVQELLPLLMTHRQNHDFTRPFRLRADHMHSYFDSQFDEGMNTFMEPFECNPSFPDKELMFSISCFNASLEYMRHNDSITAQTYFEKTVSKAKESLSLRPWASIVTCAALHNIGHIHFKKGDYASALLHYENAKEELSDTLKYFLSESTRSYDVPQDVLSYCFLCTSATLNCLAISNTYLLRQQGKDFPNDVTVSLEEAIYIQDFVVGSSPRVTGTLFNNLGRIQYALGDYFGALISYQSSLAQREMIEDIQVDTAATIFNLAETHMVCGNLETSIDAFKSYILFAESLPSEVCFMDEAKIMLGDMYSQTHELELAKEIYFSLLNSNIEKFGHIHEKVSSVYNELAYLAKEEGQHRDAIYYFEKTVEIERELIKKSDCKTRLITCLSNVGIMYQNIGDNDRALVCFQEAVNLITSFQNSRQFTAILTRAALLFEIKEEFSKAELYLREVLRSQNAAIDSESDEERLDRSSTLNLLGIIQCKQNAYERALASFRASYEIRKGSTGSTLTQLSNACFNIGECYKFIGSQELALKYFKESLNYERSMRESEISCTEINQNIISTMTQIASIYEAADEYDKALSHYQEVLALISGPGDNTNDQRLFIMHRCQSCHDHILRRTIFATGLVDGRNTCAPAA